MSNIIIADAHNLYREALCDFIRNADQGLFVQGAEDYASLRGHISNAAPDLVLIDQRDAPLDDTIGFEPLDAFPARC